MPADNGFGAHDDDRVEHRAEDASGESEQHAVSRMNSGLWHGTTQDDDLLAKDGLFDKEGGAGSEGRTQRAHDGFEDLDEHRGEKPSTGRSLDESWGNCGEFESSDRVFAANKPSTQRSKALVRNSRNCCLGQRQLVGFAT
jgi:hypothetical protein